MSDYIVQPTEDDKIFKVHKFTTNDKIPEETYTVRLNRRKRACSCPSGTYRGYCKHLTFVREFIKRYNSLDCIIVFSDDGL